MCGSEEEEGGVSNTEQRDARGTEQERQLRGSDVRAFLVLGISKDAKVYRATTHSDVCVCVGVCFADMARACACCVALLVSYGLTDRCFTQFTVTRATWARPLPAAHILYDLWFVFS